MRHFVAWPENENGFTALAACDKVSRAAIGRKRKTVCALNFHQDVG